MAIQCSNDEGLRELALFAGAGGGILGGHLLGWRTVCAVERDAYAAQVLAQRQNDGILRPFPIWSDVTTFDGKPWRGIVDVVSGGFPCQPHSSAGKHAGMEDARWLWPDFFRIICEIEPTFAWIENVRGLISTGGLENVLFDLARIGFDAEWGLLGPGNLGGSHERERFWILASNTNNKGLERCVKRTEGRLFALDNLATQGVFPRNEDDLPEPRLFGAGNGVACRVERLKAIGNGQVPIVAATAFNILRARLNQ
jgi:DNA (cytosine-5)-methyltransferase 1